MLVPFNQILYQKSIEFLTIAQELFWDQCCKNIELGGNQSV
jgi:hypothetical protein